MSRARQESQPVACYRVKLKNRRVTGGLMADGSIVWVFRRLNEKRCVESQSIRLSREAITAMVQIMAKLDAKQSAPRACQERFSLCLDCDQHNDCARYARHRANAPAESRCKASPPAGCSAADDDGRVSCPDCGKSILVTNRIDGLYVCIDCWERRYRTKFNMKPNAVRGDWRLQAASAVNRR